MGLEVAHGHNELVPHLIVELMVAGLEDLLAILKRRTVGLVKGRFACALSLVFFIGHGELVLGLAPPLEVVGGVLEEVEVGHGSFVVLAIHSELVFLKGNENQSGRPFIGRI